MLFLIAESTFYEKMINENTISFHSFEFIYSYTFLLTPNYFDISTIKTFHCPQVAVCQRISGNSHEDHTQNALLCRTNASNNRLPFFYNPLGCIYVINNTRMWILFTMELFRALWFGKRDYVLIYLFCSQANPCIFCLFNGVLENAVKLFGSLF